MRSTGGIVMLKDREKQKLLIADNSFINRALLMNIFSGEFQVYQAENGIQALEQLRKLKDLAAVILDIQMPKLDGYGVLDYMMQDERMKDIPVVVSTSSGDEESQLKALDHGAADVLIRPFNSKIVLHRVHNIVVRREADSQAIRNAALEQRLRQSETDEKTGIYNKYAFCRKTSELLRKDPHQRYVILHWDIDRFKVFNDVFGVAAGDELLARIGEDYCNSDFNMVYGHWVADHFVSCMELERFEKSDIIGELNKMMSDMPWKFEFIVRLGAYVVKDPSINVNLMCDRAQLALKSIKDSYDIHVAYYDESMRAALIEEQEIIGDMGDALSSGQFVLYLQPQYNYDSKKLYGAEVLARWAHPNKGMIPPGKFLPIFERNGYISRLDEYIWEETCKLIRRWLDEGLPAVPISVNVSRRDIYNPHMCETIKGLVDKYNVEPSLLRLEITESAYVDNPEQLISVVDKLHSYGFTVEMDDFGSGYSSLNTLKEVHVDMLKLDMKFMQSSMDNARSRSILRSVIRMAHWIKLPVIAEGVETREQADYLKSIGCIYMQGYFYARPMPAEAFEKEMRDNGADCINC
jgi:diguanylate cyclase (GGDEF)-like protein